MRAAHVAAGIGIAAGIGAAAMLVRVRGSEAPQHQSTGAPVPPSRDTPGPTVASTDPPPRPPAAARSDLEAAHAAITDQFERLGTTPPAYELQLPTGDQPPRGVMLTIHGGAWVFVGADLIHAMDQDVQRWRDRGFITLNIDYRAGRDSTTDALAFLDAMRAWQPEDVPLGATGQSAGGHLAVYLASQRPDLDIAISQGGPVDLTRLDAGTEPSASLQAAVTELFGTDGAAERSPALHAANIGARILMAHGAQDTLVDASQGAYMLAAAPDHTEVLVLDGVPNDDVDAPDTVSWVHQRLHAVEHARLVAAEQHIADDVLAGR